MDKKAIRYIIKDIVTILKNNKRGEFTLPEDVNGEMVYVFDKIKDITVDLIISRTKSVDTFAINGDYDKETDTITIKLIYNPNINLTQYYYDVIGELNDVLTHEMEHYHQYYRGEFELKRNRTKKSISYYLKPEEIGAQIKGFRRLAKLRRLPFKLVVQNWFDTHKDIHKLSNDEINKIVNVLVDTYKKSV